MEKKNKILTVVVVLLAILLFGSVSYIVYDKFIKETDVIEKANEKVDDNETLEEDEEQGLSEEEEIAIIEDELGKIFACTNGEEACVEYMWYSSMIPEITTETLNYDFFELAAPFIMEALYNQEYISVSWPYGTVYLMTDEQAQEYSNYFDIDLTFDNYDGLVGFRSYDDILEYCENNLDCEYIDNYNKYANQGYKIAYTVGDGFGTHGTYFEIEQITKNNDKYTVDVLVTANDLLVSEGIQDVIIRTSVDVEIVDGHCKFGSMIVAS